MTGRLHRIGQIVPSSDTILETEILNALDLKRHVPGAGTLLSGAY